MVMWEETLRNLPAECPRVDFEEHRTRYRSLQVIARLYAARPECFGIVKVWRPRSNREGMQTPPIADMTAIDRAAE
jgi:hypothetical protein